MRRLQSVLGEYSFYLFVNRATLLSRLCVNLIPKRLHRERATPARRHVVFALACDIWRVFTASLLAYGQKNRNFGERKSHTSNQD
jgi:hypothetical protein